MKEKLGRIKWEIIITLIISLTSVFVAIKANNISKMQAEIARNSALPTIEIKEKIEERRGFDWEESSVIEISNLSGKMNNYQAAVITFLHCGYFGSETAEYKVVDIPIENYYLYSIKEGISTGVIEKKDTANNYIKVKNLKEAIWQFNKKTETGQSIDPQIQSYLRISYLDLLNEKQVSYYLLDSIAVKMIDSESGQAQFNKHKKLTENEFSINTNRLDEVSVNEVIDKIEGILNLGDINFADQNMDTTEESKVGILNEPIITTIIGATIGIVASVLGGWIVYQQEKKGQERFAATILYNDLKSIERYLAHERSSVNLRYSNDWQHMVANCPFLKDDEVKWLYVIYDEVYNFNYSYNLKEEIGTARKEDISSYTKLQRAIFDTSNEYPNFDIYSEQYNNLMQRLQKHKQ